MLAIAKRTKTMTILGVGLAVLFFNQAAQADFTLVHESTQRYSGVITNSGLGGSIGTQISLITDPSIALGVWTVGNFDAGTILWEVLEKGFHNSATGETKITYTVGNDSLPFAIHSFMAPYDLALAGTPGTIVSASGWSGSAVAGPPRIAWVDDGLNDGIPVTETLNSFSLTWAGMLPLFQFLGNAGVDDGTISYSHADWVVSTAAVPVPGAVALGMIGLGVVGWISRRRSQQ